MPAFGGPGGMPAPVQEYIVMIGVWLGHNHRLHTDETIVSTSMEMVWQDDGFVKHMLT